MQWSRELRSAGRGLRTALRAASAMLAPSAPRGAFARRRAVPDAAPAAGDLIMVPDFGANAAGLAMLAYRPAGLASGAPLVVLLHGCGQDAAGFAADSGWMALADRVGLALVLPTQSAENNRQGCFNWFRPAEVARDHGEAGSIRAMTADAVRRFGSDPRAIHVVGLSAGGAMAVAMLAAYPDVFASGASIAGLPVGAATGAASALARMAQAGPGDRSPDAWADQVRAAAPPGFGGPWPRLSIWHGGMDTVVDPANAPLLAGQWRALHGLSEAPSAADQHGQARHEVWGTAAAPQVELWTIPTMPHGYPVAAAVVPSVARSSATMPVGISATQQIARFWGVG